MGLASVIPCFHWLLCLDWFIPLHFCCLWSADCLLGSQYTCSWTWEHGRRKKLFIVASQSRDMDIMSFVLSGSLIFKMWEACTILFFCSQMNKISSLLFYNWLLVGGRVYILIILVWTKWQTFSLSYCWHLP